MNQLQLIGCGAGLYLLMGMLVIWIRWHFGFLRATVCGIAARLGVPPERIRLVLPVAVLFWPVFAKGVITDPMDIRKAMKTAKLTGRRECECGASVVIDPSEVRRAISTGVLKTRCASCGKITETEANITYTESPKS